MLDITQMDKIARIHINLEKRTLTAYDENAHLMLFPLSASGSPVIKWTKVSPGGHMILALERMLEGLRSEGGGTV